MIRLFIGGILIGLANLIPGVSGGTMAVLTGIYEKLINAVSDIFRIKFSKKVFLILGLVFSGMLFAIITGSSILKYSVEHYEFYTYSLFWGLVLGSIPMIRRQTENIKLFPIIIGILLVVVPQLLTPDKQRTSYLLYLIGGILGGGAMVLPGVSGSLMLLIIGIYKIVVLDTIHNFKELIKNTIKLTADTKNFEYISNLILNTDSELFLYLKIVIPFGIGIVLGIIVFLIMKWALSKYNDITRNIILGLILGSLYPIFPFQKKFSFTGNILEIIISIIIIGITFCAAYYFSKIDKKKTNN